MKNPKVNRRAFPPEVFNWAIKFDIILHFFSPAKLTPARQTKIWSPAKLSGLDFFQKSGPAER
jgi:hypothetical protein